MGTRKAARRGGGSESTGGITYRAPREVWGVKQPLRYGDKNVWERIL